LDDLINGAFHVLSVRLDVVVSSAAEAEYGGLFHNAKEAEQFRHTLADLGHPQEATEIVTDNQVAKGLADNTVKQKRSKAIDMRFHWIRDRIKQGHFTIKWQAGTTNLADFFTKLHPPKYHRETRRLYVTDPPRTATPSSHVSRRNETKLQNSRSTGEGVLIDMTPKAVITRHTATKPRTDTTQPKIAVGPTVKRARHNNPYARE
jgi:hypothetical protein